MIRRLRLKEDYLYDIVNSDRTKLIKVVDAYATFPDSERYSEDEDYTNVLDRYYSTIIDLAFDVGEKTPFSSDIKDYYADPNEPGNIIVLNSEDYVGILTIKIEVLKYCEPTLNDIRSFDIRTYSESIGRCTKRIEEDLTNTENLTDTNMHDIIRDNIVNTVANFLNMEYHTREVFDAYAYEYVFGTFRSDGYVINIQHNERGTSVIFEIIYGDPEYYKYDKRMTFRIQRTGSYDDIINRCKKIASKMIGICSKAKNAGLI